jgi:hypothetical protein
MKDLDFDYYDPTNGSSMYRSRIPWVLLVWRTPKTDVLYCRRCNENEIGVICDQSPSKLKIAQFDKFLSIHKECDPNDPILEEEMESQCVRMYKRITKMKTIKEITDSVIGEFKDYDSLKMAISYKDLPGEHFFDKMSSLKEVFDVLEKNGIIVEDISGECPIYINTKYNYIEFNIDRKM